MAAKYDCSEPGQGHVNAVVSKQELFELKGAGICAQKESYAKPQS